MLELISTFTIPQIITFIVLAILAVKGFLDAKDYFVGKYNEKFNKDYSRKEKEKLLEEHYQHCKEQHGETLSLYDSLNLKIDKWIDQVGNKLGVFEDQLKLLLESDRNDIKQSIVKDYHYFVEKQGWIDDFSLDTILLRYEDYKKEGGNSYIDTLILELKSLPKRSPQ